MRAVVFDRASDVATGVIELLVSQGKSKGKTFLVSGKDLEAVAG